MVEDERVAGEGGADVRLLVLPVAMGEVDGVERGEAGYGCVAGLREGGDGGKEW